MSAYYSDGTVTIYHGDFHEYHIRDADLLLTDPPYGIGYVTAWRSRQDKLVHEIEGDKEGISNSDILHMLAALKNNRHWYIFSSPNRIQNFPVRPKQWLAWDKGDRGTVGDLKAGFGEAWEAIAYGMKGRRELNGKRPRSVIRCDWSGAMDPRHPTVKPVELLQRFILWSTFEGETVFDPFMGSGTTLRAAKELGRKAIGIEIEERYCEIATQRLSQEVLMF